MDNKGDNGFEFPYHAKSPVTNKRIFFETKEDIYKELEMCYDEIMEKGIQNIGETLYIEHFYFCNTSELLEQKYQQRIKDYTYCKAFNCSPYPSLQETPARIVEDFMTIDNEIKINKASMKKE